MQIKDNPFQDHGGVKYLHKIKSLHPLKNHVIVRDMNFEGRKLSSGIVLLNDDGKTDGIRPRWAKVYAVGPEQTDISVDQWILIEHGRWTRGLKVEIDNEEFVIRRVDPACIIGVQDEEPDVDETISTSVYAERKER
jgi:co-chaperonin GroES (HSP10)